LAGVILQNQKVLATAPLHISVDGAANKVWEELSGKYKSEELEKFLLRLETKGAELRAFLAIKNYKALDRPGLDVNERPELVEMPEEDVVELAKAMAESIIDLAGHEKELMKIYAQSHTYADAVKLQNELANRKVTNVPVKMTSGWHIHRVLTTAAVEALQQHDYLEMAWTTQACTQEYIDATLANPQHPHLDDDVIAAMRCEPITAAEFTARVEKGEIRSIKKRSPYFRYSELVDLYIKSDGRLPRKTQREFEKQWQLVMTRVYASLDGVFTTCNNAGSDLIDIGFKPDLIFCDEAGQVGLAAFAVVVTAHTGWKAVYIFGDHQQLQPFRIAGRLCEFSENGKVSILGLMESKGFKIIRFKVQYRMAPAIMKWPNEYFYNGELRVHHSLEADNEVREAGRKISEEFYWIKGPDDRGFEAKIRNKAFLDWATFAVIIE